MGDPKQQKKQYSTPLRPWDRERIEREAELVRKYGLKSKKEVWKTETILRGFRGEARDLMEASGEQAEKEAHQLLDRLEDLGLVGEDSSVVDVLRLDIDDVLSRRLQSIVHSKGLANTPDQARQMVDHGHIVIGDKSVTEPGYLVSAEEEEDVDFREGSSYEEQFEAGEIGTSVDAEAVEVE